MAWYEIALPPDIAAIGRLTDWIARSCAAEGLAAEVTFKLTLALEEAVINVVNYAFAELPPPHVIRVRLEIGAEALAAEVIDNGRAFDPSTVPEPDLAAPLELRDPGGLGIHLMRHMVDRVDYRRADGINRLRLETARAGRG